MNTLHMTSEDWARYIQEYQPKNGMELATFKTDLLKYAKTGNLESGISAVRFKQLAASFPDIVNSFEYKQTMRLDRESQWIDWTN